MKVFLSWSGERSQLIAEALRDWLPKVIQALQPWMSSVDIDRGARWSTDIAEELEQTRFGILCLTPENLDAPWIHFEAGALSKTLQKTFVCPYLHEIEPADLKGPLVQFNAARMNREDTHKLILTINEALENPLSPDTIEESFDIWWSKLEEKLNNLPQPRSKAKYKRPDREILEEILDLVREQRRMTLSEESVLDMFDSNDVVIDAVSTTNSNFPPGTHVIHPKYGKGLVISREGKDPLIKLTISFPGFGQKKLVERFANLTKA